MKTTESVGPWAVYRMTIHGKPTALLAVCGQSEWDAMEQNQPGHQTLVQGKIQNEGEAERLARTGSGIVTDAGSDK